MHWFYLLALATTLWTIANYLWRLEQVVSIAMKLAGVISLVVGFAYAPYWGQLLVAAFLVSRYCLYTYVHYRVL